MAALTGSNLAHLVLTSLFTVRAVLSAVRRFCPPAPLCGWLHGSVPGQGFPITILCREVRSENNVVQTEHRCLSQTDLVPLISC